MIMITIMRTTTIMTEASLLPLFAWLSPSYPVGAYAYSHGLEWAVETGDVKDRETLLRWIYDVMRHGGGRNDAILFAEAYRAARDDPSCIAGIAELAAALAPTRERKLETIQQGRAFMDATLAAWPSPQLRAHADRAGDEIAYPVAVALAAAAHDLPLTRTLEADLLAFAANLVSAVVRAVPLGQTDGQKAIAVLAPLAQDIALSPRPRRSMISAARLCAAISHPCVTKLNIRDCSAHELKHRSTARRHWRPRRFRQDGADGGALQEDARCL